MKPPPLLSATPRASWLLLSVLALLLPTHIALGIDEDNNCLDDALEQLLAERFVPSFILHGPRLVEPEPVEIMTQSTADLFCKKYLADGQMACPPNCPPDIPYLQSNMPLVRPPAEHYFHIDVHDGQPIWAINVGYVPHHEFGSLESDEDEWPVVYATEGPQYQPTVYAHFFKPTGNCLSGGNWVIQYWVFYPYNDFINNHEGDWEHINVVLTSADPSTSQIAQLQYHFHDKFLNIYPQSAGGLLNKVVILDGTHPTIFVGGVARNGAQVMLDEGDLSGASFPAPGEWNDVQDVNVPGFVDIGELVQPGGKLIHYEEINVRVFPEVANLGPTYWSAHLDKQWMKSSIPWGQMETETKGEWVENWPLNREVGNDSPIGPPFQNTWNSLTAPAVYDQAPVNLSLQGPAIIVLLEAEGASGETIVLNSNLTIDGAQKTAPGYKMISPFPGGSLAATVSIERCVVEDGVSYTFSNWDDGSTELTRTFSVSATNTFRARYAQHLNDVTSESALTRVGNGVRAAWIDVDNDGDQDLAVDDPSIGPGTISFYYNELSPSGLRTFAALDLFTQGGSSEGMACGDYDNDGAVDVYMTNGTLLRNIWTSSQGFFEIVPTAGTPLDDAGPVIHAAAWADFDKDGRLDIYLGTHGENRLVRNEGGGNWTSITSGPLGDAGYTVAVAWSDFDHDGFEDLFISNGMANGSVKLFKNDWGNSGSFIPIASPFTAEGIWGQSVALGDYDNNGYEDLFFTRNLANSGHLFANNGGVFAEVINSGLEIASGKSAGWVDFDSDGDLDLCVVSDTFYPDVNRLYENRDGQFVDVLASLGGQLSVMGSRTLAVGDYDGSGTADILIGAVYSDGESTHLLSNLGLCNEVRSYVSVVPRAVISNGSSIGARVRARTASRNISRVLKGGAGNGNQDALEVTIGLGHDAPLVDTLEVRWPSGVVRQLTNVVPNQQIVLYECTLQVVSPNGGEVILSGTPITVTWTPSPDLCSPSLEASVSLDGGQTYSFSHVVPNTGSYTFEPMWAMSTAIRVRVRNGSVTSLSDVSDGTLSMWDIEDAGVSATYSSFCQNTTSRLGITVTWQTNVSTDSGGDVLELWSPSHPTPGFGTPSAIVSGGAASSSHQLSWFGHCQTGPWLYRVKSRKGADEAVSDWQIQITSCASCSQCPPPGCELE